MFRPLSIHSNITCLRPSKGVYLSIYRSYTSSRNDNVSSSTPPDSILKSIKNLPSEQEAKRSEFSKWFDIKMDSLQATMFAAGRTLNDVTGYSAIEALKQSIEDQHKELKKYRIQLRAAKDKYLAAVDQRSNSQREVNELLQRKHQWSGEDLQRFTDLYRSDHENEHRVSSTALESDDAERVLEECQQELTRLISARYREEQVWSDKIRRASTWGTWGLMGFNVLLFLLVQLGLEPWKRRRLVGSFEEKVYDALEKTTELQEERIKKLEEVIESKREGETKREGEIIINETPNPLNWNSLFSRIQAGFNESETIPISTIEFISTIGLGALIGILGTLSITAFR